MHKRLEGPAGLFPIYTGTAKPSGAAINLYFISADKRSRYFNTTGPYLGQETLCAAAVHAKQVLHESHTDENCALTF